MGSIRTCLLEEETNMGSITPFLIHEETLYEVNKGFPVIRMHFIWGPK
jgi:hypothetical protein